jgi:hypothetical protein
MDAPGLPSYSFHGGSKEEIAAMHPDLMSSACPPSLMEFAGWHLINAASFALEVHVRFVANRGLTVLPSLLDRLSNRWE